MTLVMAYVILIAASISACAVVLESVARSRGLAGRWVWVSALGLTVAVTVLAMVVPRKIDTGEASPLFDVSVSTASEGNAKILPSPSPVVSWEPFFTTADTFLPGAWVLASIVLLIAIGVGQRRLRRERARSRAAELAGHRVLLTESIGPAVAGIREPVVFVPRWVLALDEPSQQLLLTHEMEHVKRRDTAMLFTGAMAAAVMPWNPVVWWMVRRLRLAVEQDCDARVLARHPGIRRYADLLLMAASRHGLASRLLAAHFGEHTSDLMRRIEAMTSSERIHWRQLVGATLVASALIVAACETPRPDPVAPIDMRKEAVAESRAVTVDFFDPAKLRSTVFVLSSDGKSLGRYAGEIPVADLPPDGIQQIRAEEQTCPMISSGLGGSDKCVTLWITLKPGHSLNVREIELRKLPYKRTSDSDSLTTVMEFKVPEIEIVKGKTAMLMSDATLAAERGVLPGPVKVSGSAVETSVAEIRDSGAVYTASNELIEQEKPQTRISLRGWSRRLDPMPNILVRRADGSELRRFIADPGRTYTTSPIDDIKSEDIAAIEVYKGNSCPASAKIGCPLIIIRLKAGPGQAYRRR